MTQAEIKLCSLLLCEHFGEIVEKVGTQLIRMGGQTLWMISQNTSMSLDQQQKRGLVEYEAQCSRMLRILRYPRYIYTAKTLYSDTGELIVEELLLNDGKTMDYSEVSATFTCLADTHFVQRCPSPSESSESAETQPPPTPTLAFNEKDMYAVPKLNLIGRGKRKHSDNAKEDGDRGGKRSRQDPESEEPLADSGIYWQVNIDRFHQHFRDQAIVSAVANRMDQILDQYLTLLADDPLEFVGKSGESGGGMYVINLHKGLASLATATLESIVQERFGSRCARIFRLLLRKRHLEQKQIEDFAMIPGKEAKEMMYKMLSANIVALQEIPKTPDHAPSRTFYLYTVNTLASARMLLQRCYKCVANLIERRLHETKENRRLLEKSQRVEAILASVQATGAEEAQLQEIEEMITAPERQQLETLKHNVNKIDASENQVDETIFILESYINSTIRH
ncbi:hypothetical protein Chor_014858 [Crotalus horridus]